MSDTKTMDMEMVSDPNETSGSSPPGETEVTVVLQDKLTRSELQLANLVAGLLRHHGREGELLRTLVVRQLGNLPEDLRTVPNLKSKGGAYRVVEHVELNHGLTLAAKLVNPIIQTVQVKGETKVDRGLVIIKLSGVETDQEASIARLEEVKRERLSLGLMGRVIIGEVSHEDAHPVLKSLGGISGDHFHGEANALGETFNRAEKTRAAAAARKAKKDGDK